TLTLPATWVNASRLEQVLRRSLGPHSHNILDVTFDFPVDCKVMVDAGVRLLSLANQLAHTTKRVRLVFQAGTEGTMGYLNRVGFFDFLDPEIEVTPRRPRISGARIHRGNSSNLVEIARISKDGRDQDLPRKLADVVRQSCDARADVEELEGASWTIFAELIDNVFEHSSTALDGYAALQVYQGGDRLVVAVSDSGKGIMETLRPSIASEFPRLVHLSDLDLLVEVFRQGLSRHGNDRGCGLKGSAEKAIKFRADLDIRLPHQRVLLTPSRGRYQANIAHCFDQLPLLWGTHIAFAFNLGLERAH
ncbi:MAG: ATP-binding protein, partial [Chloroflexi bacterium]|nr:ATP-binding protein [Chloroflexota bacterium]